ncbi:MAG TPA: zinc ribbon domain-containing protein [bacterium (Candidatus Stahlbacteria)]|nr:zinc ribbon domain-containing protein [Candidatus Stahlbacteria bacterium]
MPLKRCRECGQEVSDSAKACPHCGAPDPVKMELSGVGYEYRSRLTIYGIPLIHIAWGSDARGKRRVARGIIAIGQFGIGLITFAQFGIGVLFGLGQFMFGLFAIGQFAIAIIFGLGQFATGYLAIGQVAVGYYALCQAGFAKYIWSSAHKDPEVWIFIHRGIDQIKNFLHL